jgi:hypothetical protein
MYLTAARVTIGANGDPIGWPMGKTMSTWLSDLSDEPAVTAAVENIIAEEQAKVAA